MTKALCSATPQTKPRIDAPPYSSGAPTEPHPCRRSQEPVLYPGSGLTEKHKFLCCMKTTLHESVTDVVVSTHHSEVVGQEEIKEYIREQLAPRALGNWFHSAISFHVNPTGSFCKGGPSTDCGVTGRKIIVDTYGGAARHGGGAFSGKDPSKVDRSAAYFCRFVARQIVRQASRGGPRFRLPTQSA